MEHERAALFFLAHRAWGCAESEHSVHAGRLRWFGLSSSSRPGLEMALSCARKPIRAVREVKRHEFGKHYTARHVWCSRTTPLEVTVAKLDHFDEHDVDPAHFFTLCKALSNDGQFWESSRKVTVRPLWTEILRFVRHRNRPVVFAVVAATYVIPRSTRRFP